MDIIEKLNKLAELRAQSVAIGLHFDELRKAILTPEIQAALDEIDAEYRTALDALNGGITEIEGEIKAEVLSIGATVKGDALMAVWNKGRVSWDSKLLEGFVLAHPELLAARKEGEPTVTIRAR